MAIRLLTMDDVEKLQEYLALYTSECMFICSNLKVAGINYKNADFHGEYWGHFSSPLEQLQGIIVHYWNGNIMMYAPDKKILEQLVGHLKNNAKRPIVGILGPSIQVESVIKELYLSQAHYHINRKEGLYEISLGEIGEMIIPRNFDIINAKEVSRDILIEWRKAYEKEALGASDDNELEKRAAQTVNRLSHGGDCWILVLNGVPVSMSAFNARVEDMVQVGPVWSPPEQRNKGFAKLLLAHRLLKEKRKGTKKAVLFTSNPAAINVYQSIGFKKIGHYHIALLKEPVNL